MLTVGDDEEMEGTFSEIIDVEPKETEPEVDYTIYFVVGGLSVIGAFVIVVIARRR